MKLGIVSQRTHLNVQVVVVIEDGPLKSLGDGLRGLLVYDVRR